jgi:uncharacterized membrane protein
MAATPPNNIQRPPANVIAALTYLVGFVTGIIFMYVEPYDKDDYVRFHAYQSIAFSVAVFAFNVIIGVFIAVLPRGLGGLFSFVQGLANLGLAVLWVYLMYQAYIGNRWRIPVLSDFMDSMRAPHA